MERHRSEEKTRGKKYVGVARLFLSSSQVEDADLRLNLVGEGRSDEGFCINLRRLYGINL